MRHFILIACVAWAFVCVPSARSSDDPTDYPHRVLRNDTGTRVTVMLVDAVKGFYRGTRFDWAGHIAQAKYRGHTFFGLWRTPHDPTNFEHGVGPTDEFGIQNPPGYERAKAGEPFLKIGVGLLRRIDDKPYHFSTKYPVLDAGRWSHSSGGRGQSVSFQHELRTDVDWGYRYNKSMRLVDDQPAFEIERTLKNIEGKDIKTASYNHNFIRIDDELIGPSYELELSEDLQAEVEGPARFDGRRLTFTDKVEKPLMIYFKGQPKRVAELGGGFALRPSFDITITNRRTGGRMVIAHHFDVSELRLWVTSTAICPEPFVNVDLGPAQSMSWTTTYRLGTVDEIKP
ncbi:MAG: hypothetical protein WD894_22490 [Pirellulales bacterium]